MRLEKFIVILFRAFREAAATFDGHRPDTISLFGEVFVGLTP